MKNFMKKILFSLFAISLVHQITPMENTGNGPAIISSSTDTQTHSKNKQRNDSFLNAVYGDELEEIERLLIEGADINTKGEAGCTALHIAATTRCEETCRLLLKYGANTDCGWYNEPIWRVAVRHSGDAATIKLLLEDHILNQLKDSYSKSVVTFLCCLKHKKETKSDTLATTLYNQAQTLLQPYCIFNLRRCTHGIDQTNSYGMTALMDAAKSGNVELCQLLIEYGADVNIKRILGNSKIETALSIARAMREYHSPRIWGDKKEFLAKFDNVCNLLIAHGAVEIKEDEN